MLEQWPPDVRRARDLVLEHGWNATAYQIVNPGITHWFPGRGDAVVGYVRYAGVRVVAGAPVCSPDRLREVTNEFERDSRLHHDDVCYFGAEARLESILRSSANHSLALMGAQPVWDPAAWSSIIQGHPSLRGQLNRARNKGVSIAEHLGGETGVLRNVLDEWLRNRRLPPLHFLVEPSTLERLDDRRVFVARSADAMPVAFAVLSPVPARNGWLVEQFPRLPSAPNGTVELLLSYAAETVARDGDTYLTLGLAPLARRSVERTAEPGWLTFLLDLAAAHGRRFYNFAGLEAFKTKFDPQGWESIFAIQAAPAFTPRALYGIAGAFASQSPIRLMASAAIRTAFR